MKNLIFFLFTLVTCTILAREIKPLSFEQFQLENELKNTEGLTFEYDVREVGKYGMRRSDGSYFYGYKPSEAPRTVYELGVGEKFKSFKLQDFGTPLFPVLNQASCGSCVVFSVIANYMDNLMLRGIDVSPTGLSPQHLMNCGTGGQCNGAYGEGICRDLVNMKGKLHSESDYPYTARSGRCRDVSGSLFGVEVKYKTIDPSDRTILAALHNGQAISVGVAADNRWSSYRSGVYNYPGSMGTNHYVVIEGLDCEDAVDAEGYCHFDENGNLPYGTGTYLVRNSWGKNWGQSGYMVTKIRTSSGRRINNIAGGSGNAQILDIVDFPMPVNKPETFSFETKSAKFNVAIKANPSFRGDGVKKALVKALEAIGE